MENNYFVFAKETFELDRFHICSWEFKNNSALIEFGGELKITDLPLKNDISLYLFIPWISEKHTINDLYEKLKESENCRFIFNDSVTGNTFLDDGQKKEGVIQKFASRSPLCIIPITSIIDEKSKIVTININLKAYNEKYQDNKSNLYFRFFIEPNLSLLSTRKYGISRSTIIYDVKINEKRNLPDNSVIDKREYKLCKINSCFFFNILPNSYDLTFFDAAALKNIRTLEYGSFKRYLGDGRVKKDELVVVFNKKENKESYGFFSIFAKERIGPGQFALAVLVNLVSGILLFLPSFRISNSVTFFSKCFWIKLPIEVYVSIFVGLMIIIYFFWPKFIIPFNRLYIIIFKRNTRK